MTEQAADVVVRQSIVVQAPIERAFQIYTEGLASWWPMSTHHIGEVEPATVVTELRQGGRQYERAPDGTECTWGYVLAYEPPHRIVTSWHLQGDWKFDPDPEKASVVTVTFTPEGDSQTRVELEHGELWRHGEGAEHIREQISQPGGWRGLLELFAKAAEAA